MDICKFVQSFFRSSHLDPQVNQSAIILIPKKDKVENITDFRPISLYNIFQKKKKSLYNIQYKFISKILMWQLRPIFQRFVSQSQGAFLSGKRSLDNIIIAKEFFHQMNQPHEKRKISALKVDINKAYHSISWDFFFACLNNLGFSQEVISTIASCITTVSY